MSENAITRSRRCGLKDIYMAKVTKNDENAYTAETPIKFARAINANITDNYSSETIYSEDGTEEVLTQYTGTDVELEVNTLAPQDRALVWNRLYQNGFLVESAEDEPAELALGYRTRQLNGKYEFVWFYCGKFNKGQSETYKTIEDKKNTQTSSLTASFYERKKADKITVDATAQEKHLFRIRVDESNLAADATQAAEAIKKWFSTVQEYNAVEAQAAAKAAAAATK